MSDLLSPDVVVVRTLTEQACKQMIFPDLTLACYRHACAALSWTPSHSLSCVATLPTGSQVLFPHHAADYSTISWNEITLKVDWSLSVKDSLSFLFTTEWGVQYTFTFRFPTPQVYPHYLKIGIQHAQ